MLIKNALTMVPRAAGPYNPSPLSIPPSSYDTPSTNTIMIMCPMFLQNKMLVSESDVYIFTIWFRVVNIIKQATTRMLRDSVIRCLEKRMAKWGVLAPIRLPINRADARDSPCGKVYTNIWKLQSSTTAAYSSTPK